MSIIELKGIYTAYEGGDKPVIRDLSLNVDKGEFVIIGGPNGAGKTTLLESINGLVRTTHGRAAVCGIENGLQLKVIRDADDPIECALNLDFIADAFDLLGPEMSIALISEKQPTVAGAPDNPWTVVTMPIKL